MPMSKKSTLFKNVNDFEDGRGKLEGCEVKMEKNEYDMLGMVEFQSPSDETIKTILAFAQSYSYVPSRTLEGIDMYLN